MRINVETNPITYKFIVNITVQSIDKNGEIYLNKLMHHYHNYNFKIINGSYKRESVKHDRIGTHNPYGWDIIKVKLNLEREVKNIHSPEDYINNQLHKEIYQIFDLFRNHVVINDDKLDYINWINESWVILND